MPKEKEQNSERETEERREAALKRLLATSHKPLGKEESRIEGGGRECSLIKP
jgi:hypothetical protein